MAELLANLLTPLAIGNRIVFVWDSRIEIYAQAALRTLWDCDTFGVDSRLALIGFAHEIAELLNLNDESTLKRRHAYFSVPHTTAGDFEECFLEIKPGCMALAGIRHVNSEKDKPFVHMMLGFEPTFGDLDKLRGVASKDFRPFGPLYLSFDLRPSLPLALDLQRGGFAGKSYMVGGIQTQSQISQSLGCGLVEFKKVAAESIWNWFESEYAKLHAENPEIMSWVPGSDFESLRSAEIEGLLLAAYVDGVQAGVIAGCRVPILGTPSLLISEILVSSCLRGQGLGCDLQRKLIESLAGSVQMVWGTIDARNKPATRAALRMGRKAIRTEFFLPL